MQVCLSRQFKLKRNIFLTAILITDLNGYVNSLIDYRFRRTTRRRTTLRFFGFLAGKSGTASG